MGGSTDVTPVVRSAPPPPDTTRKNGEVMTEEKARSLIPDVAATLQGPHVSFGDFFEVHCGSRGLARPGEDLTPVMRDAYLALYERAHDAFERANGEIELDFWCKRMRTGIVATRKRTRFGRGQLELHAIVNWEEADFAVVPLLNQIERIQLKAENLDGKDRDACLGLVVSAYSEVFDAMDRARRPGGAYNEKELDLIRAHISDIDSFYAARLRARANPLYFAGVMAGIAALMVITGTILGVGAATQTGLLTSPPLLLSFLVGAAGSVFSVMTRFGDEEVLVKNPEASGGLIRFMGALRPLIGGSSGVIVHGFILAGILGIPMPSDATKVPYFVLALAFLGGFSERWVKDILSKPPAPGGSHADGNGSKG